VVGMLEYSNEDRAETLLIIPKKEPGFLISTLDNLIT
jgi:hypothetical protein